MILEVIKFILSIIIGMTALQLVKGEKVLNLVSLEFVVAIGIAYAIIQLVFAFTAELKRPTS